MGAKGQVGANHSASPSKEARRARPLSVKACAYPDRLIECLARQPLADEVTEATAAEEAISEERRAC